MRICCVVAVGGMVKRISSHLGARGFIAGLFEKPKPSRGMPNIMSSLPLLFSS